MPPALRVAIRVAIQPDIAGHRRAAIRADRAPVRGKCGKMSGSADAKARNQADDGTVRGKPGKMPGNGQGTTRLESVWGRKALVSSNLTPSVR
jgi:hypothetical protein